MKVAICYIVSMKQRPTSIAHLVTREGRASSWRAVRSTDGTMFIYHYSTLMAEVRDNTFTQVSWGWGSMSDKCGLAKLRRGAMEAGYEVRQADGL